VPSFSKTTIIGHIGAAPELRYSASGKAMANFSVAVSDSKKLPDGSWEDGTQWWRVQMFGEMAERLCGDYEDGRPKLPKGATVLAVGRTKVNLWKDKQGETRADLELFADTVQNLERKPKEDGQPGFTPKPQQQPRATLKEAFADLPFE
jgi:single-strand DNA-binding protein